MIGLIILGVYVLGYLASFRSIAWAMIMDVNDGNIQYVDNTDVVWGFSLSLLASLFWPFYMLSFGVKRLAASEKIDFVWLVQPRSARRYWNNKHREWDLIERENEVSRLERELGIGRS